MNLELTRAAVRGLLRRAAADRRSQAAAFFALLLVFALWGARAVRGGDTRPGGAPDAPQGEEAAVERPDVDARSLEERQRDAEAAWERALTDTRARLGARNDGEFLCFAAGEGMLDTVRHLVGRGVSVNSLDRYGRSTLMHAASGPYLRPGYDPRAVTGYDSQAARAAAAEVVAYLLSQPGVRVDLLADDGNNAYVYALAGQVAPLPFGVNSGVFPRGTVGPVLGPDREAVRLIRRAGGGWPAFAPAGGPPAYAPSDLPEAGGEALYRALHTKVFALGGQVREREPVLVAALDRVDLRAQPHEPWLEEEAGREFRVGLLLLLNRLVGEGARPFPLYDTEGWRDVGLPPAVQEQIARLRRQEREGGIATDAWHAQARALNKAILDAFFPELTPAGAPPPLAGPPDGSAPTGPAAALENTIRENYVSRDDLYPSTRTPARSPYRP